MCSVGIQECTGNIDDLFSSPGEYQTRVLGYDCNFGCLQVLFCGIFQELLTVFRVDDGCNPANSSDGQVSTRLQAYLEMLSEGKEGKRS